MAQRQVRQDCRCGVRCGHVPPTRVGANLRANGGSGSAPQCGLVLTREQVPEVNSSPAPNPDLPARASRIPDSGIDARTFRTALSRIPTSVVVVAALRKDRPIGMIIGTFCSVSLDPLLVGFLADRSSTTLPHLLVAERMSFTVLRETCLDMVEAFRRPSSERFTDLEWQVDPEFGTPTFPSSVLTVQGTVHSVSDAGDHQFVLTHVQGVTAAGLARPLVFCAGRLTRMDPGQLIANDIWQLGWGDE